MDIDILRNFLALSRSLNVTKTSQELNVAQSTLSAQIQKLEKDVNAQLIDRSNRPRLTPAGRELVEVASDIVNLYDGFKRRNNQNDRTQEDEPILIQVPHRREAILIEILRKTVNFKKMHPDVKIDMLETQNESVEGNSSTRRIDCSYFGNYTKKPKAPEGYELIPLIDEEFIIWMDESSPLLERDLLCPADLEGYSLPIPVGGSDEKGFLPIMYEELFSAHNAKPDIRPRYCESVDDFFLSKMKKGDLVILNRGSQAIAMMNEMNGRVSRKFNPPIHSTAYLAFRREGQSQALSQFKKFILDSYEGAAF